jgi:hypothetical protein
MNLVYAYETKKNRGEPTTPEEDYAYSLAKSHLEKPTYKVDPNTGETIIVTPKLPVMAGATVAPEATAPAPAAPAAEGAQPFQSLIDELTAPEPTAEQDLNAAIAAEDAAAAPAVAPATVAAPVPEAPATAAPTSTTRQVGGLEIETLPGGQKKMTPEESAKVAGLQNGVNELAKARSVLIDKNGKVNRVGVMTANTPWTEGQTARQQIYRAIEGVKRAFTGAALTDSERADFENMFIPSWRDTDQGVIDKMNAVDAWIRDTYENMQSGRPWLQDLPPEQQWEEIKKTIPSRGTSTAPASDGAMLPGGTAENPLGLPGGPTNVSP